MIPRTRAILTLAPIGLLLAFWTGSLLRAPERILAHPAEAVVIDRPAGYSLVPDGRPRRSSFLMEQAFFDQAFDGERGECPQDPHGAIVNHHLLAKGLIARTLTCLDPETPVVALIGPNHFSRGNGPVLASAFVWETPYGKLEPAEDELKALVSRGVLRVDEAPFKEEHAIGNLVAFIKRTAPKAEILPIILKDGADAETIAALVQALDDVLPENAAIVSSLDFSHELTPVAARFHDAKSLAVIETGQLDRISPLDIDSEPSLRVLLELMQRRGTAAFVQTGHSNSAEVFGQDLDDVTSYITGLFVPGEASVPGEAYKPSATMLFAGDVMLDRWVGDLIEKNGLPWVFQPIRRLLKGSDAVIANLEGAVSDNPKESRDRDDQPLHFVFDAARLAELKAAGFSHFSLSNNHSNNNHGETGVATTRRLLDEQGIRHFGGTRNETGKGSGVAEGYLRIALVGYNAFGGGGLTPILDEIVQAKKESDAVIVMPHWGNEYQVQPSAEQRRVARVLIDAGADAVIGAHPHVIQPVEVYKGRAIFYSLGNFVFDQLQRTDTRRGLALGVEVVAEDRIAFSLIPVIAENVQLRLAKSAERATLLETIASGSVADDATLQGLRNGYFTLPL